MSVRRVNPCQVREGDVGSRREHGGTSGASTGVFGWREKGGKRTVTVPGRFFPQASVAFILRIRFLNSSVGVLSPLGRKGF